MNGELFFRHADALWQMAQMAFNRGNALSARGFVQRYLEVAPRSAESMWLGYQVEMALDDPAAAQRYARILREEFPQSEQARRLQEAERVRGR
jgi:type IV pilus assembly protein PilF